MKPRDNNSLLKHWRTLAAERRETASVQRDVELFQWHSGVARGRELCIREMEQMLGITSRSPEPSLPRPSRCAPR